MAASHGLGSQGQSSHTQRRPKSPARRLALYGGRVDELSRLLAASGALWVPPLVCVGASCRLGCTSLRLLPRFAWRAGVVVSAACCGRVACVRTGLFQPPPRACFGSGGTRLKGKMQRAGRGVRHEVDVQVPRRRSWSTRAPAWRASLHKGQPAASRGLSWGCLGAHQAVGSCLCCRRLNIVAQSIYIQRRQTQRLRQHSRSSAEEALNMRTFAFAVAACLLVSVSFAEVHAAPRSPRACSANGRRDAERDSVAACRPAARAIRTRRRPAARPTRVGVAAAPEFIGPGSGRRPQRARLELQPVDPAVFHQRSA